MGSNFYICGPKKLGVQFFILGWGTKLGSNFILGVTKIRDQIFGGAGAINCFYFILGSKKNWVQFFLFWGGSKKIGSNFLGAVQFFYFWGPKKWGDNFFYFGASKKNRVNFFILGVQTIFGIILWGPKTKRGQIFLILFLGVQKLLGGSIFIFGVHFFILVGPIILDPKNKKMRPPIFLDAQK